MNDRSKDLIYQAVEGITAHDSDRAEDLNDIGWQKGDSYYGHRLMEIPRDEWTDAYYAEAYNMLVKYSKTQVPALGIEWSEIDKPDVAADSSVRQIARQHASRKAAAEKMKSEAFITIVEGRIELTLPRDAHDARDDFKTTVGSRSFDWDTKTWSAPLSSAKSAVEWADKWGVPVGDPLREEAAKAPAVVKPEGAHVAFDGSNYKVTWQKNHPRFGELLDAIRAVGGRWQKKEAYWKVAEGNAPALAEMVKRFEIETDDNVDFEAAVAAHTEAIEASFAQDANIEIVTPEGLEPFPFQRAGVAYALRARRCFIGDEMGLGKTIQAILAINEDDAWPAVVVCPSLPKLNWKREIEKWVPGKSVYVADGRKALPYMQLFGVDVLVINYDILPYWVDTIIEWGPKSLVLDESHYVKNPAAKRTKAAIKLAKKIPADGLRLNLTGTGSKNGRPIELIPQLRILDRLDEFGGDKNYRFRYCNPSYNGFGWDFTGASNLDELNTKMRATCYVRRRRRDIFTELDEVERPSFEVEGDEVVMRDYYKAEADVVGYIRAHIEEMTGDSREARIAAMRAAAAEKLVQMNKLRMLSGLAKVKPAIEWVEQYLEQTDGKLLIFAHHNEVLDALVEAFDCDVIRGGQSGAAGARKRQEIEDRFQSPDGPRLIVLGIMAASMAITLTAATDALFIEFAWTPGDMDQAESRAYGRVNDLHGLTSHWMMATPMDGDMVELLQDKLVNMKGMLDGEVEAEKNKSVAGEVAKRMMKRSKASGGADEITALQQEALTDVMAIAGF